MIDTTALDSASTRLAWSNVLYIGGGALTVLAAIIVLLDKRAASIGSRSSAPLLAEASGVFAAIISLVGTMGAYHYSNVVVHLKDNDLSHYQKDADERIANANAKATKASEETERLRQQNLQLQGSLDQVADRQGGVENREANIESNLAKVSAQSAPRVFRATAHELGYLSKFADCTVSLESDLVANDAQALERQIAHTLEGYLRITTAQTLGPDLDSPEEQHVVTIHYGPRPHDAELARALQGFMKNSHIPVVIGPGEKREMVNTSSNAASAHLPPNCAVVYVGPK